MHDPDLRLCLCRKGMVVSISPMKCKLQPKNIPDFLQSGAGRELKFLNWPEEALHSHRYPARSLTLQIQRKLPSPGGFPHTQLSIPGHQGQLLHESFNRVLSIRSSWRSGAVLLHNQPSRERTPEQLLNKCPVYCASHSTRGWTGIQSESNLRCNRSNTS